MLLGKHAFIQAALLISVFEQRTSFQMFYFMENNREISVKCRWVSECAVSSAVDSWRSLGWVSGGKASENV